MSSTGRGVERRESDFYPTPSWATLRLLQHVALPGGRWLEPSAGDGAIIRAVDSVRDDVRWWANEIREECRPALVDHADWVSFEDFLQKPGTGKRRFDVCLGNPPFLFAQEFILHALLGCDQVVFLLRLSFLESQKREGFFSKVGVPDVFVLPERPSFTGEGTDSCAYAWMRWKADRSQEGRISILYDKRQTSLFPEAP